MQKEAPCASEAREGRKQAYQHLRRLVLVTTNSTGHSEEMGYCGCSQELTLCHETEEVTSKEEIIPQGDPVLLN